MHGAGIVIKKTPVCVSASNKGRTPFWGRTPTVGVPLFSTPSAVRTDCSQFSFLARLILHLLPRYGGTHALTS